MLKRYYRIVLALLAAAFFPFGAAQAASGEVSSSLEAFLVVPGKDGQEKFEPAKRVSPGETIEYRIAYENGTEGPLSEFVINGRVPENTLFVEGRDKTSHTATLEAMVADLGWVRVPAFREVTAEDGTRQRVRVGAHEYSAVRWRFNEAMPPGARFEATYRVTVNN